MRVAVIGATGQTGQLVCSQSLRSGHEVVALGRDGARLRRVIDPHAQLTIAGCDPLSVSELSTHLGGVDAVIHCLGIGGKGSGGTTTLVSDSVEATLSAMRHCNVSRIICMSNIGAGGTGTWFANKIVIPVFLRWLRPIIADKERMEDSLQSSATQWISVRLPNIVDGQDKAVRVSRDGRGLSLSITATSVASFLVAQLTTDLYVNSFPSISN